MVGLLLGHHTTITITIQPSNLMIQVPELAQPVQFLSVHSLKSCQGTQSSQLPCTRGRLQLPGTKCKKLAPSVKPSGAGGW